MADWNGFKKNGITYIPNDATARERISTIEGKIPSAASSSNKLVDTSTMTTELNGKVNVSSVGANNGVAGLDANGRVPSSQLPSYVDDVLEYASLSLFPATGETGKIYIALDTNKTFRWSGSAYVEISESLALGETSSTAYAGNKGKANADAIAAMKDGSSIDSFGDVETALAGKVDKVTGKGLSTNDYDNTAKGIVDTAQDNIKANTKLIKDTVGWSGKNKLRVTANTQTVNGVSFTINNDKSVKANGTATADVYFNVFSYSEQPMLPIGNYLFGCGVAKTDNYQSYLYERNADNTGWGAAYVDETGNGVAYNRTADRRFSVILYVKNGATINNVTFYPMIRDASILDTSYEPYFNSTAFPRSEQAVLGAKNLLQNTGVSGTSSGVSFVVNADKSVTCSNTASGGNGQFTVNADLSYLPKNTPLILSGFPSTGTAIKRMFVRWIDGGNTVYKVDQGEGVTFSIPSTATNIVCLIVYSDGQTANETVYPMIRLASDPDSTYVPYAMTNRELTDEKANKDMTLIPSSADIDDYKENGSYYWDTAPTHAPEGGGYRKMNVYNANTIVHQMVFGGDGKMYLRQFDPSQQVWKNFYKFTSTEITP